MQKITIFVGILLFLLGFVNYSIAAFEHVTALIPVVIGAVIALCGWQASRSPEKRKLYMHIAVGCAALLLVASLGRIFTMPAVEERKDFNKAIALWGSVVLCFVLLGIYVQSFLKARSGGGMGEEAAEASPEAPVEPAPEASKEEASGERDESNTKPGS